MVEARLWGSLIKAGADIAVDGLVSEIRPFTLVNESMTENKNPIN